MWSSAEVLEDRSSPWWSSSLSLSSMEANTALSIQTHNRAESRAYSHQQPSVGRCSYRIHQVLPCPVTPACTWNAILVLVVLGVIAAALIVFGEFIPAVHVNDVLKSCDAWGVEWPWRWTKDRVINWTHRLVSLDKRKAHFPRLNSYSTWRN